MGDEPTCQELTDYSDPPSFAAEIQGQSLTFYPSGADRRTALLEMVAEARERIDICYYIYAEDAVGAALRDALVAAARRGVAVTLIIDRFGASVTDDFLRPLTEAGGRYYFFSPRWGFRYLIRNHQKMIIADNRQAIIGGFNIADGYFDPPAKNGWNDLGIKIEGDAVAGLTEWFALLEAWSMRSRPPFRDIRRTVQGWDWRTSNGNVRWLVGGPTRGESSLARCITADLVEGERLDIFMAYFSPPYLLLRRIAQVARKGHARLLLAAKSDNGATLGAARSLYHYLLKRGAQIWEFSPCKLHTKLLVLDDATYLGSANFDMRSLYINLEIVLRIEDRELADTMREFVSDHIAASEAITPDLHRQRRTLFSRFRWFLGWILVSVIDYTVSRRLNLGN